MMNDKLMLFTEFFKSCYQFFHGGDFHTEFILDSNAISMDSINAMTPFNGFIVYSVINYQLSIIAFSLLSKCSKRRSKVRITFEYYAMKNGAWFCSYVHWVL
jgi:hypothetical protein